MLRRRSGSSSSSSLSEDDPSYIPTGNEDESFDGHSKYGINEEGISNWEAGVSLAKAIMGAGSFALPWAFSKMGYLAGPLVLVAFLGLSVHSIGLLVDCARWLRTNNGNRSNSYVDVARATFGRNGAALAYASSIASSIGVCGSYLVFVAANLLVLLEVESNDVSSERQMFLLLVWIVALPIAVLLSSVKDPKRFATVSMWGDLSVVAGMLAVVIYGLVFVKDQRTRFAWQECVAIGAPKDMALALGSIGYLFLVHFLVLPIESSMESIPNILGENITPDYETGTESSHRQKKQGVSHRSSKKDRFQSVVVRTFLVCGGIGGSFGIIGYILFGNNTQQIVLLNGEGSIGMKIVQSLLCIDLLLTYPVVMRPSIGILEEHWKTILLKNKTKQNLQLSKEEDSGDDGLQMISLIPVQGVRDDSITSTLGERNNSNNVVHHSSNDDAHHHDKEDKTAVIVLDNSTHMIVCLLLGVVAAAAGSFVPAFGLLSGLVGGVSQTFLAFVLPPLMWGRKQQLQNQSVVDYNASVRSCFVILPPREKALVLCGLGLIGWTLQSTWSELKIGSV